MAIKYVTTGGNDANTCTNDSSDACLTVQRAVAVAASGDTISVAAGTYDTAALNWLNTSCDGKTLSIVGAGLANTMLRSNNINYLMWTNTTTGNLTFTGFTFASQAEPNTSIFHLNGAGATFHFVDCNFDSATTTGHGINFASASTCTLDNCSITLEGAANTKSLVYLPNASTFTATDCTMVGGAGHTINFAATGANGTVKIHGGSITSNNLDDNYMVVNVGAGTTSGKLYVRGATINFNKFGVYAQRGLSWVELTDNTVTCTGNASTGVAIAIGTDSNNIAPANVCGGGRIIGNIVTFTGATDTSHGILIGEGSGVVECAHNRVLRADAALVVKSDSNLIHHNVFSTGDAADAANGVWFRHCSNNVFAYNTIYTATGDGIVLDHQTTDPAVYCTGNRFGYNVIYGNAYVYNEDNPTGASNQFDYNVGYATTANRWAYFNGTTYATVALADAAWDAYSTDFEFNDSHSEQADPQFLGETGGDFRLRNSSPAKGTMNPDSPNLSIWNDKGAWQIWIPQASPRSPVNRSSIRY